MNDTKATALTRYRGFSLVELMVAMTLGLLLLAGVGNLIMNTSASHRALMQASRLMDNSRYATALLHEELRHAGYYGRLFSPGVPPAAADPCDTTASALADAMPYAIQGYDAVTGTPPLSCLSDDQHLDGTDILVLRRASTEPGGTPLNDLQAGAAYLQTHPGQFRLLPADGDPTADAAKFDLTERDGSRTPIRRYRVDIYFVSPCREASCAGVSEPVPTLKRLELGTNGASPVITGPVPLVEGVENLQVDYGIDHNDDGAPDESSPGAGDDYVTLPADPAAWGNVVTARVHLLGRAIEPSAGYQDDKRYDLGEQGTTGAANDAFKRRVFIVTTRIVNRSSQREA